MLVVPDWILSIAGYYTKERPDTAGPNGRVTWILSYFDRRAEVAQILTAAGYRIVARRAFPGVDAYRAVRMSRS